MKTRSSSKAQGNQPDACLHVPAELIRLVVTELKDDADQLSKCALINKEWSLQATELLFHTVVLGVEGKKTKTKPKTRCRQLVSLLAKRPILCTYIRSLSIVEPSGILNHRSTKAFLAASLLGSGNNASRGLPAFLPLLTHLRCVTLDGTDCARWSYVPSESQVAIFATFERPNIRHVCIKNFVGCPIMPFLEYGHLNELKFEHFWSALEEEEAPFPLNNTIPSSNLGISGGASASQEAHALQLDTLQLGHGYMDILLLLSSAWAYNGHGSKALTKHLIIDTTSAFEPTQGNIHELWRKVPEAFLGSIQKYSITNHRSQSSSDDFPDLLKISKFPNLTYLRVHLRLDNIETERDKYERGSFLDLISSLEQSTMSLLEEITLDFELHCIYRLSRYANLAAYGSDGPPFPPLISLYPWEKLDKVFARQPQDRFPNLRALNLEFRPTKDSLPQPFQARANKIPEMMSFSKNRNILALSAHELTIPNIDDTDYFCY